MSAPRVSNNLIDIESPKFQESQLQFQEFPPQASSSTTKIDLGTGNFEDELPNTSNVDLSDDQDDSRSSKYGIFSLEYFQQLFDVTTDQVVDRVIWAILPKPGMNYLQHHIGAKPDLYGPFWVCVTLVFTIAISGNIANYLQSPDTHNYHWRYDFHAVTFAATAIFAYAWLLPAVLWTIMKWQSSEESRIGLLELLCVYGYSLSIYIPISMLWLIQISWLQWILVLLGSAMSGSILVTAVWPAFKGRSVFLLASILAFHLLLATGFMLYFFHVPQVSYKPIVVKTVQDIVSVRNLTDPPKA